MSQILAIAATTETELNRSPFQVGNPVHLNSVPGATVYGLNLAGKDARNGDYQRWVGDGVDVAWTSAEVVNLANAHVDSGVLNAADVLRVVVKVNDVVQKRVASGATPGAGEFKTSGAGPITITFGTAPAAGAKIEVFLAASADIVATTLTANVPKEWAAYQMVYASAACQAIRLTC